MSFVVPLPPAALRGNSRAHWTERKRAADEYSEIIGNQWIDICGIFRTAYLLEDIPWERAAVEYEWRYAGARPDLDNVARAIKVLQDTLCASPKVRSWNDSSYVSRYFLGLIEEDGGIEPVTFKRQKVKTKAEECVVVTIERLEDA